MLIRTLFGLTALVTCSFWALKYPTPTAAPAAPFIAPAAEPNPVELGDVHWLRQLDSAMQVAQRTQRPILILFQEVPGCSNCTRYGSVVMRHPLLVEAVESLFVPLCIYNNKGGADAAAIQHFNEPAWNNPVVRIVRPDGTDLVPRMADFRSAAALTNGMCVALRAAGHPVPTYLDLLAQEQTSRERGLTTATFSMYCFWSGEGTLGALDGVVETAPGFQDGHEVVRVQYDSTVIQWDDFQSVINKNNIQSCSKNNGFRTDREPKYYLSRTAWSGVPMTTLQACRANSLVGRGQSPQSVLSPRQVALYERLTKRRDYTNYIAHPDLIAAWKKANAHG
jgi:Thioredoxin-like